mgnify:CR=1 FL=1
MARRPGSRYRRPPDIEVLTNAIEKFGGWRTSWPTEARPVDLDGTDLTGTFRDPRERVTISEKEVQYACLPFPSGA